MEKLDIEFVVQILTDDFVYILGGKQGKKSPNFAIFQQLCCDLFNVLRKDANLFINLISIMVSSLLVV